MSGERWLGGAGLGRTFTVRPTTASHRPAPWTHDGHSHAYAAPSSRVRNSADFFSRDEDEEDDEEEDEKDAVDFFESGASPPVLASSGHPLTAWGFSQHEHNSVRLSLS